MFGEVGLEAFVCYLEEFRFGLVERIDALGVDHRVDRTHDPFLELQLVTVLMNLLLQIHYYVKGAQKPPCD